MDYKQKYEEALNRAKSLIMSDNLEVAEYIFPELKEKFENEKIRKKVIEVLKLNIKGAESQMQASQGVNRTFEVYACNKVISWLEKQGEQKISDIDNKFIRMRETKPKDISEFLDRLTTVEQEFLWEHIAKIRELDKEEQGEQKPADKIEPIFNVGDKIQYSKGCGTIMTVEKIENGEYIFANNMGHTTIESGNKWYLVEQKPAWSEEDETYLNTIVSDLDYSKAIHNKAKCNFIDKEIKWFKSLKNRVQPQPKQEWSEEDKEMYKKIETAIDSYYAPFSRDAEEMSEWFKNLKYRVQPKQEWSEEDKEVINLLLELIYEQDKLSPRIPSNEKRKRMLSWLKSLKDRVQPM